MKRFLTATALLLFVIANISSVISNPLIIAVGLQPQMTIDNLGTIRIVYGKGDSIYCATSNDNGVTFVDIQMVGVVKDMHLGMSRGPQVASSKNYTIVSAMAKDGSIPIFQLNHASGKWVKTTLVNDQPDSAPEGLMSIAADKEDNFYAVWLDIRNDKQNKICFAESTDQGMTWSKNKIAYQSPDKTVCECCKPNIVVNQSNIFIMFRNWMNGSRDLYLLSSKNKGSTFTQPLKLGNGTWQLNGCPMDGGGLTVNEKNEISAVWQRKGEIFYSKPNQAEKQVAVGRRCSITDSNNPIITWQDGQHLKIKELNKDDVLDIGEGNFVKAIRTKDNKILCAWEKDGNITYRKL